MARSLRDEREAAASFGQTYRSAAGRADAAVQRAVFGANVGATGYTTVAQADALAERLELRPGLRLLDVGAGRGWPALHLAKLTGCEAVLTDLPATALKDASFRARRQRVRGRCAIVQASGRAPPFRPRTFDAVVHTDVL